MFSHELRAMKREKLSITFTRKRGQEVDSLEGENEVNFPELATLPGSFDPPMSFTSGCPLPRGLKRQTSDRVEEKKLKTARGYLQIGCRIEEVWALNEAPGIGVKR